MIRAKVELAKMAVARKVLFDNPMLEADELEKAARDALGEHLAPTEITSQMIKTVCCFHVGIALPLTSVRSETSPQLPGTE